MNKFKRLYNIMIAVGKEWILDEDKGTVRFVSRKDGKKCCWVLTNVYPEDGILKKYLIRRIFNG